MPNRILQSVSTPTLPPSLEDLRRLFRPRMREIPQALADWPTGRGPLADVPLLDPADVAPRTFTELAGTVRVASSSATLVTVAAMLEIPDAGGLLLAAMTLNPHDLGSHVDTHLSRQVLAQVGATSSTAAADDHVQVEVAALLGTTQEGDVPAAGVGIVRPLVLADPAAFPLPQDPRVYDDALYRAAEAAVSEDREVVSDLAGPALRPMNGRKARIWSPLFEVVRAATAGLAARGAGLGS